MSDVAAAPYIEPPEVGARNLRVASQLWASATAFFFVAFLFAYFYLRALDTKAAWHPKGVKAPMTLGVIIALVLLASGVATWLAARKLAASDDAGFRLFGTVGLLLGLVAAVLQIVEWSTIGFGPTNGAFASVFLGWTGVYFLFVVGAMYWIETVVATSFRHRGSTDESLQIGSSASAAAFYWEVVAGIGVATWFVLYVL